MSGNDIEFKCTELPDQNVFDCEKDGCPSSADVSATTNQSNSIWLVCLKHAEKMSEGEVWW